MELCRDETGHPIYSAGNSAVVFRIRHHDRIGALRGYFRPIPHLREIYGDQRIEIDRKGNRI